MRACDVRRVRERERTTMLMEGVEGQGVEAKQCSKWQRRKRKKGRSGTGEEGEGEGRRGMIIVVGAVEDDDGTAKRG